jgi:hypothetical protein
VVVNHVFAKDLYALKNTKAYKQSKNGEKVRMSVSPTASAQDESATADSSIDVDDLYEQLQ